MSALETRLKGIFGGCFFLLMYFLIKVELGVGGGGGGAEELDCSAFTPG